ncbi:MAG TPA: glycoside hydrolase family 28 protein [Tepidisphaeraceae bacterium]|nr:glycoside hydrolase family 28 protein [Tepidisphaeraceae bacterium]
MKRAVVRALPEADSTARPDVPAPFKMPKLRPPVFADRVVDICDHGAIGDGRTDCTQAFAAAIKQCADNGGGRVNVPEGRWLTGPIHLRSDIELHLQEGAKIWFNNEPELYLPSVLVRWGGIECHNYSPLIYARDCRNIAITGHGSMLGRGEAWWRWAALQERARARQYKIASEESSVERRMVVDAEFPLRPQFIHTINCENILLEDFTIAEAGPCATIHLASCQNVTVRRLHIRATEGPNTEGMILDSTSNVIVEDCDLATGHDCIVLQAGLSTNCSQNVGPTENVIVRRIRATAGQAGFAIGPCVFGGVKNVFVHDCKFDGLDSAIALKATRGRPGVIEGIHIRDIQIGQITGDAIQIATEPDAFDKPRGAAALFKDIRISHITCDQARQAARIAGMTDASLSQLRLENLSITAEQGLSCAAVSGMELIDLRISPRIGPMLSLKDVQNVVIQGLNIAHSRGVFLDLRGRHTRDIRLRGEVSDHARPSIVLGIDVPDDAIVHE